MISRAGHAVGKLLLCLQETSGSFGPIIEEKVRRLERELGDIKVYASSSGKMSTNLVLDWMDDVLAPLKKSI